MPRPVAKPRTAQQRARAEYSKIPRKGKQADPAEYTKQPHAYGDVLLTGGKLGGALERDVLYWIERNTWGKNISRKEGIIERPEYAKLSITQLARLCQVWDEDKQRLRPVERKSIAIALARLERDGIIASRDRKGCGKTTAKMYKLTPENWKKAPAYKPPTPKQLAEIEATVEEEENEDDGGSPVIPEAGAAVDVDPGKHSRPQPVAVAIAKDQPAVTMRVVYNPLGFSEPVTCRATPGKNGRVVFSFHPRSYGSAQPQFSAVSSPSKNDVSEEKARVNSYEAFISQFVRQIFGKAADKQLIESIISNAGSAPLETYKAVVNAKFLNTRKRHSSGLLIELAKDAAETHKADRLKSWQQAADRARQSAAAPAGEGEQAPAPAIAHSERTAAYLDPDRCWYCLGAKQIGTGRDRGDCGVCRGSGKAPQLARKAARA